MRHVKFAYGDLTIYGEAWTLEELLEQEKALGADPQELEFTRRHYTRLYEQGGTYGMWYSEACVEGEVGSNLAKFTPISKEQFEHAQAKRWV